MGSSIIAAGPWLRGPWELAHRIVIRCMGHEYVVHMQVIDCDLGHAFYTHGNYYPCPVATVPGKPLDDAWTTFENRVRRQMDIAPRPAPEIKENADVDDSHI